MPRRPERKTIFDPVHGVVELEGAALALVQHPAFQRLWGIRQTGFAHLVFPGANHTRLEHSLGAYWVANAMADRLDLGDEARGTVAAAALLHDLGHPPFSHTLEPPLVEATGAGHEARSRALIEGAVDGLPAGTEPLSDLLRRHGLDPRRIADLVDPPRTGAEEPLASMLHGPIDADRIDYLQRDAHYTGVAHGAIDAVRLLATVRIHRGRLAFAEKGRSAVEGFVVGRSLMYASVYYHKTVRAAEVMAQAAVERLPGFPATARDLLHATDAELTVRVADAGGAPSTLIEAVLSRRLHKRALGWRTAGARPLARFRALARDPPARRAWEDAIAERLGGRSGDVLLDLGGLEAPARAGAGFADVGVLVGDRLTFPFRREPPWIAFARRPPAPWAVSVYTVPRLRQPAARLLARGGALPAPRRPRRV